MGRGHHLHGLSGTAKGRQHAQQPAFLVKACAGEFGEFWTYLGVYHQGFSQALTP